jgi:hypothetical protein
MAWDLSSGVLNLWGGFDGVRYFEGCEAWIYSCLRVKSPLRAVYAGRGKLDMICMVSNIKDTFL